MASSLAAPQLIVVTGKGGVGKSVVAAALAGELAAGGRRTLALEIDPRENLHQLFGAPPSGGEVAEVAPHLELQNLKPLEVVDWLLERQVRLGPLVRRIRESAIYQRFVEGAPGLKEMAILGHALRLVEGRVPGASPVDTVVLDAPATGHGLYLLHAPRLFAEVIREGPLAEIAAEVDAFVADPERCGVVVVTQAEEMPVDEALELRAALVERYGRPPGLLVVNGLYPPFPPAVVPEDDRLLALWAHRWEVNRRELERLEQAWEGPRAELPLLPIAAGPALLAELGERLVGGLGEAAWT